MNITTRDGKKISLAECQGARIKGCEKHPINAGKGCPDCEAEFMKWIIGVIFFGMPEGPQVEVRLDGAKLNELGP